MNVASKQQSASLDLQPRSSSQRSPFDSQELESMMSSGSSLNLAIKPDACQVNWQAGAKATGNQRSLNLNLEGIGTNTPNALSKTLQGINNWMSGWLGAQPAPNSDAQVSQPPQPRAGSQPFNRENQPSALPHSSETFPKADSTLLNNAAQPKQTKHGSNPKSNVKNITVQKGDTLWGIAQIQLGDGNRWQELRKPDGSPFKQAEVVNLKIGDQVILPNRNQSTSAQPVQNQKPESNLQPVPPKGASGIERGSYSPNVNREFLDKVKGIGERLQVAPEYLMAVMGFETGGSYSPSEKNKAGSGATGLIQFMPKTAAGLGTSTQQLSKMSDMQQLDYVEKYMSRQSGRLKSLEDVYMAVLYPKAVGQPSDSAIFSKGTKAYTQNAGLDINKDGKVTSAEATEKVRKFLPKSGIFNT